MAVRYLFSQAHRPNLKGLKRTNRQAGRFAWRNQADTIKDACWSEAFEQTLPRRSLRNDRRAPPARERVIRRRHLSRTPWSGTLGLLRSLAETDILQGCKSLERPLAGRHKKNSSRNALHGTSSDSLAAETGYCSSAAGRASSPPR
jgi:hypothetical protein